MTSKNNLLSQGIWLGMANSSNMIVAILSSVILSRYFDKIEYGTYKQIIFVYNTFLVIFQAGLPSVFSFFLPRYSLPEGKYIMRKLNMMLFVLGLLFSVFLYLFSSSIADLLNNPELAGGLKIFSLFPLFTLPTLGIEGLYVSLKNTKFIAFYQITTRLVMLCCIVLPIVLINGASYKVAVIGWGIASAFAFFVALWAKNKPYKDFVAERVIGISKQIFRYSLPIMGSSILLLLFNSVNQIVISRYCGVETFAEFSNGFLTLPFIPIFVAPFRQLLVPIFSKSSQVNEYDNAISEFNKGVVKLSIIVIPLILFSMFFAKDIMAFLYGEQYRSSSVYFQINLFYNLFELFPITVVLSSIGRTDVQFKIDVACTAFIWGINLLLVDIGIVSSILVATIFVVVNTCMRYVIPWLWMRRKQGLQKLVFTKTLKTAMIVVAHSGFLLFLVLIVNRMLLESLGCIVRLLADFFLFVILLMTTSRFFKISYIDMFKVIRNSK